MTVIHNENLNGTRNLTQQDIQTPSHFINEEIVQTTTTTQQSISPIRPNLTTPKNTNTSLAQVTLQSTVKPSVAPKYSHMDYQTYRPMTDVKIKRQIIEHSLKNICNLTQQYGIYTIEFSTPNTAHRKYIIQTDDIELKFSKVFIEYIKSIQYHNSQRANSIFTNEVFAIIYSYISILEKTEIQNISYITSKHPNIQKYEMKSQYFQHFYI